MTTKTNRKRPSGLVLSVFYALLLSKGAVVFGQQPQAAFTASVTRGCATLRVKFTDNSTGSPTSWQWKFGVAGTSTQQNPTFDFSTPGRYTVELTIRNAQGSNTLSKTNYIEVLASPVAQFSANVTGGCAPLQSTFTDLSTPGSGTINSRIWNFDDGSISSNTNPQHVFQNPGEYNIKLKVTNTSGCSDSIIKPQFIKTSSPITAGFRNTQAITCKTPETISFTNLSVGIPPLYATWYFGDGETSQQQNPTHTYTIGGTFPVKLVIKNAYGCSDSVTIARAVTINNIRTSFSGPDSVCAGSYALFTNTSSIRASGVDWFTGNMLVSSNLSTATFSWNNPGIYPVSIFANYPSCSDSFTKMIRVLSLPTANFNAVNVSACQGPLTTQFTNTSTGSVRWLWDFGDGTNDSIRNPAHTYTSQGTYSVSLTAINQYGCKKKIINSELVIIKKPFVQIANLPAEGCVPFSIQPVPGVSTVDGVFTATWHDGLGNTYPGLIPPSFSYNSQGNYTVKLIVTSTGGCTDSAVATGGIRVGTKPTANFTADRTSQCTFQPVLFTNQSTTSDKWWWHFRDTIITSEHASFSPRDTGLYNVMLIASNNGCKDTIIKSNYIRSLPPITRFKSQIDCNNQLNVLFTDSSVQPISWNWDFGDGNSASSQNPVHQYNALGNYTVKLTTGSGFCTHTDSVTILLLAINPDFSSSDTLACKYEQIRLRATNINKSHIRNYRWDFGDGNSIITNTDSVTYAYPNSGRFAIALTVTDINNCSYTITKPGLIKVNGPKAGFSMTPLNGCAPLLVEFTDTSRTDGANDLVSWKWNFGNNRTQTLNAPPSVPLTSVYPDTGTFYPSLVVTDMIGCKDSVRATVPVFVTRPKAGFINSNSNICANNTVQFSNTSKGNNLSYRWQFGDSTFSTAPNENKTYNATGNYTVKLIVTDVNGCRDSVERPDLVRVQNVQAAFEMSDSMTSCAPIDIYFTNTSLFSTTQNWDFGDGTSSTLPNPTHRYSAPGNYTVRITARRSDNCISETTKLIRIYPSASTLSVLSPLTGCQPLTMSLKASTAGPVRYEWDFNDGSIISSRDSLITYTYTATGNYLPVVRMRDSTGCILTARATDSIRIVGSNLDFQTSKSLLCGLEPLLFQNTTRTPAGTRFKWDFGDGTVSSAFSPTHQYQNNGFYTIRLSAISSFGCKDTMIRYDFVKVVTQPEISIGRDTGFCGSTLVTLSGQIIRSDSLPLTWSWDFDNGNNANGQNPPPQLFSVPRNYRVRASITNSNGCLDTANLLLTIRPIPPVDVIPDTVVCKGNTIQLRTTGAQTYSWQPSTNLSCSNCSNPIASLVNDAKYRVTGTSADGCTHTDSITISIQQPFNLQSALYDDTLCIGETTQFVVSGADRYKWTPETGLSNPRIGQPQASPDQTTRYRVIGSDLNNCFSDTLYFPVTVYPYPEVNAGEDRIINPGSSVQLSILFSSDVTSWNWSPADDLSCNRCPAPFASPQFNKTYKISVSNPGGCSASDEVAVRLSCDNSNLNLPNAFTPNNDGRNDIIYPKSTGIYSIVSFVIFNRMGEVVFRNGNFMPNVQSAGWNGMFKGVPAAAGTYVYEIACICNNNNVLRFRGNITLIR